MRITVGMSGGVDSSVAALLLKRAGHDVSGLFMQNWEDDDPGQKGMSDCHADADRKDALAVCARIGIPFQHANFAAEYRKRVFAHFLDEYRAGRTPNPDVLCNREIKFGSFLAAALDDGAQKIATGHYARNAFEDGRWKLLRARDGDKDQTYFLHTLDQAQIGATLFPLGELHKTEVRRIANEAALPVAAKKDSTGICFIGERDFRGFLAHYLPARPGELRDPAGQVLGEHAGAMFYTLGQRSGLHIGGRASGNGDAWYVVGKDVAANVVYVDQGHDSPWLASRSLTASNAHWIAGAAPARRFDCTAMTRYRQAPQTCHVEIDGGRCMVRFDTPQRAVAPGQSVVFYLGDECLGGAVIDDTDAPALREMA
ncbi:MAG: tRNA 2-thiouridine(34) synthase MnmA [Rhodanobacteraceae bacterium]|nr:MAG: tRNA 2-thiouridine(34) synthase MnmA [Rhodanobacteraceae bacterium]